MLFSNATVSYISYLEISSWFFGSTCGGLNNWNNWILRYPLCVFWSRCYNGRRVWGHQVQITALWDSEQRNQPSVSIAFEISSYNSWYSQTSINHEPRQCWGSGDWSRIPEKSIPTAYSGISFRIKPRLMDEGIFRIFENLYSRIFFLFLIFFCGFK